MTEYQAVDVFTPTTPAIATFVERDTVNSKLVSALKTPGTQIVVYGHSGCGKSTLLMNKLQQLKESYIKTHCVIGTTFEQIILDAFDQLNSYYEVERSTSKSAKISSSLSGDYAAIKAQVASELSTQEQAKQGRLLPPQLTPQALAHFLGRAECCWVLEDFHKIEPKHKVRLAQVMKLFVDMAAQYKKLRIIVIGAVDTARQVIEYDPEMRNRVAEISVPLMEEKELRKIVTTGEELLNFTMPSAVRDGIVRYSSGLPAICHQICLNICFVAEIYKTRAIRVVISISELNKAVKMYLENASDTIKGAFDKATRRMRQRRYDNGNLILQALAQCPQDGATHAEILVLVRKQEANYPAGSLTQYLNRLTTIERGALIRYDSASGRYSYNNPLYLVYAQMKLTQPNTDIDLSKLTLADVAELTKAVLTIIKKF